MSEGLYSLDLTLQYDAYDSIRKTGPYLRNMIPDIES